VQFPPLNVIELTTPLTFGFHEVTVYGAVALKLKMLFRVYVVLNRLIVVKEPTAYIVLPHCTSCLTFWGEPVLASCGVPLAGVADTGPLAALAAPGAASPAAMVAAHAARLMAAHLR
jgi:hypothetical protein